MVDTGCNDISDCFQLLISWSRIERKFYNVVVFLCRHTNTQQFLSSLHDGVGNLGLTYLAVGVCDVLKFSY